MGSLLSNTIANPKGELKSITTRSGLVLDGPTVPMPPPFINPEEDERVEETLNETRNNGGFTIKKMLKSLISNKEKLIELANTPLNENFSAVILKKLPEKLGIARDVFVSVGKFTFLADFVIVDYESDPRVPLILGVANETHSYHMSIGNDDLSLCCGSDLREIEYFAITMILSRYMDLSTLKISGILIHENLFEITNCATPEKNVKKATNASLILEDSYPSLPLYELPFHKEVPGLGALLSFSSENEEKVFNPEILISKRVHTLFSPKLSPSGALKLSKVIKMFVMPDGDFALLLWRGHPFSDCSVSPFLSPLTSSRFPGFLKPLVLSVFVLRSQELHILSFILGIRYPNLID
ncbi:hypothetical protein Tco_0540312 [Tanacetum coccineum]